MGNTETRNFHEQTFEIMSLKLNSHLKYYQRLISNSSFKVLFNRSNFKCYSLAAISTLYFVEHNKQNEWHSRELFLERNALVNSTDGGGNGISGGGTGGGGIERSNNVLFNTGNYWDGSRYISKKVRSKKYLRMIKIVRIMKKNRNGNFHFS